MNSEAIARHEAGHVIGAVFNSIIVTGVSANPMDAATETRWRRPTTAKQAMATLKKLAIVDLSGPAAEGDTITYDAARFDEEHALMCATAVVLLRSGADAFDEHIWTQASELVEQWRTEAAALISKHQAAVSRVAAALSKGALLAQDIDALIADEAG